MYSFGWSANEIYLLTWKKIFFSKTLCCVCFSRSLDKCFWKLIQYIFLSFISINISLNWYHLIILFLLRSVLKKSCLNSGNFQTNAFVNCNHYKQQMLPSCYRHVLNKNVLVSMNKLLYAWQTEKLGAINALKSKRASKKLTESANEWAHSKQLCHLT